MQKSTFKFLAPIFCGMILTACYHPGLNGQNDFSVSAAVTRFIGTLTGDESKRALYDFNDTLRHKWTNLPVGLVPRPGIQYGSLSDQSRMAFHRVLTALLSSQGYLKTTSIMRLDDILNELYQTAYDEGKIDGAALKRMQNLRWAHGNYYISIWGSPNRTQPWGLNFGGHHIAISFTAVGDQVTMSPYFIGTDPSEVKSAKYAGLRVLSKEEDYGFMLINMLTSVQKAKAILSGEIPKDIITNPNSPQRIDGYYGLPAKQMSKQQVSMLKLLMEEYLHNFDHNYAHQLIQKIEKSGMKKIFFAWIGSLENNKPHYYIINGPDFLIEYDNVGFQNDGNHIHAIFREKGNNFGEDILKAHYLQSGH
ncbi:MAG: DUF3500 domain-containing protein [Saprospiraceae bacterium]|jgi:hypothetical protein|nr:DUF3500 domain-containing protein [Saprospiraceae bacterium]MBK7371941.1 DUF3500 domain-containing protein [Saprospiraceae bacterium]MBK7435591.1 DUF3500 domain-containing protein [Saprospiraceae bacterium]MBK7606244.1 DUF3500 domain-containing protein [Saprospiraceae bacterium]MBK8281984.1 DUF3500 domain-containing protein [Saprospiraceae bacterium]